mmetsp:Transcript_1791/g.3901  ORF Transcript_1791/g.3901 Transcript_1791/m.3901 type:complete len:84 (+) Transcript_1791:2520-2771(+)
MLVLWVSPCFHPIPIGGPELQQGLSLAILSYWRISTSANRTFFDLDEHPHVVAVCAALESALIDPFEIPFNSGVESLAAALSV